MQRRCNMLVYICTNDGLSVFRLQWRKLDRKLFNGINHHFETDIQVCPNEDLVFCVIRAFR